MNRSCKLISLALLTSMWSNSFANGGPVEWTPGKPAGGIVPKQQTTIALVKEDLDITILDLNTYAVEANYLLSNTAGAGTVKYGVPLYWVEEFKPNEAAAAISISVAGKSYRCAAINPIRRKPEHEDEMIGPSGDAWCVADIDIPKGESIPLKLKYQAKLEYVDWDYSKSARREFSNRFLEYPLKPAGYWHGNPEMNIKVHLGPYTGHIIKATPLGAKVTSNSFGWQFTDADLKKLNKLSIEFDSKPLLQHNELASWNLNAHSSQRLSGEITVSSALAGNSYVAKNLMDGNPATAWCTGQQSGGNGASFSILFDNKKGVDPCPIQGIALIPGYAKSAQTYLYNNKITRMRIEDCNASSSYTIVSWKPNDNYNQSSVFLPTYHGTFVPSENAEVSAGRWKPRKYEIPNYAQPSCLRFTILDVIPGERYSDSCISEVAFIRNCG